MSGPEESYAELAARITRVSFADAIEGLIFDGPPSRTKVDLVAHSLGIPTQVIAGEVERRLLAEDRAMSAPPYTEEELEAAQLSPPWLVEHYLYRNVAVLCAPGGYSKTTIVLWESIHLALGWPLYGLRTSRSKTLLVTAEDSREELAARLRELMSAMDLSPQDRRTCLESVRVLDVVGRRFRLCELDKNGNVEMGANVDRFIAAYADQGFGLVVFDPLVSFGAPEESVNSAAQGAIAAARRIMRALDCCVRFVHHTGQAVLRENITDQYAPRGGTALSDGARMVAVLGRPGDKEDVPFPDGDNVFVLVRAKCNYTRQQPKIFIKRCEFGFEFAAEVSQTEDQKLKVIEDQVWQFLHHQLGSGRRLSRRLLEDARQIIGVSRDGVRHAVTALILSGRLEERELPKDEQRGAGKAYLHPVSISRGDASDIPRDR